MDENPSHDSDDSCLSSDGFEIIQPVEPELNIAGNGSFEDLKQSLSEVLMDSDMPSTGLKIDSDTQKLDKCPTNEKTIIDSNKLIGKLCHEKDTKVINKVNSTEHLELKQCPKEVRDPLRYMVSSHENEKQVTSTTTTPSSTDDDCNLFHMVTYLGAATINVGNDEREIQRNMAILNAQAIEHAIEVTLSVPSTSEGCVVLFEPNSSIEIASFKVHRIIFCARGQSESPEASCFAFSCSHGDGGDNSVFYQCHVFKVSSEISVEDVVLCFANAFSRGPKHSQSKTELSSPRVVNNRTNEQMFLFEISLEVKEEDAKGNFNSCPKDRTCFKLHSGILKKVVMTVQQISNKELIIERCFGLLINSGPPDKNSPHRDMHLLEDVSMNIIGDERKQYIITGQWDPAEPVFEALNMETKDNRVSLNVAVDLVISKIQEPVRFCLETEARIFPPTERIWSFPSKKMTEHFCLTWKETATKDNDHSVCEVTRVETRKEHEYKRLGLSLNLRNIPNNLIPPISTPIDPEEESDNDEPLLSGSGEVSKDCPKGELEYWDDVLHKWQANEKRPKQLIALVRKGIPEALRGEVWPRLVGVAEDRDMMETYRVLITQDSPCEQVIQRDINRTFPAHEFFKENGGTGQDALYKISKAYSVYDTEVGYCQGLSFLAAALLLHMPEEQAFCVLVKIMFDYHLRDLFKDNFEVLHMKFYQLEKIIEDQTPDLHAHFMQLGVEAHMFGSQWFLTLFTAKFPLFLVFHILDIFLCEGMDTIFQVALALLMMSKKELLTMDFEGILKYFRVSLPKKYRSEETARQLLKTAVTIKIKKLKKYEKEYLMIKEQERQQANPVERLERENKRLMETNLRLEQENDDIAHELVTSKIQLRNDLDMVEDKADALNKELLSTKSLLVDTEEEKKRLEIEAAQVKEMCRRELQRVEMENSRNNAIIADYKQICSQLSQRLEKEQAMSKEILSRLKEQIKDCKQCHDLIGDQIEGPVLRVAPEGDPKLSDALQQVRELELELAQTKLALVEAQCRNQDLMHQLNSAMTELQSSKNTWLHKTLSSIREATKKDAGVKDPKESA